MHIVNIYMYMCVINWRKGIGKIYIMLLKNADSKERDCGGKKVIENSMFTYIPVAFG